MEITKREILFSVIIIFIMLVIGVCLDSKIQDSKQEELSEYYRAVKIENQEMFQYALDNRYKYRFKRKNQNKSRGVLYMGCC